MILTIITLIFLRYGVQCEDTALDKYEDEIGFPVLARNEETLVWPLYQSQFKSGFLCRQKQLKSLHIKLQSCKIVILKNSLKDYRSVMFLQEKKL